MRDAYAIDAMISIIDAKAHMGCCDVIFTSHMHVGDLPVYNATDLRHPCMVQASCVSNSVKMMCDEDSADAALLTGPNAGGKSTLLKAILLSTIMAQTLTIAPCVSLTMSPYSHIHSHINVPDVQGSKSLYEAEMDRAKESMIVLAEMKKTSPNRFSLLVMDEVFSSTNPIEGIAGAYSVAKNLASSCNATLIVSTHFLYLRKLATLKRGDGSRMFQLLQMPVKIDGSNHNAISYPYKLCSGVCEQLIALELLRMSGFPKSVVDDALEIKRILLTVPVRKSRSGQESRETQRVGCVTRNEKQ